MQPRALPPLPQHHNGGGEGPVAPPRRSILPNGPHHAQPHSNYQQVHQHPSQQQFSGVVPPLPPKPRLQPGGPSSQFHGATDQQQYSQQQQQQYQQQAPFQQQYSPYQPEAPPPLPPSPIYSELEHQYQEPPPPLPDDLPPPYYDEFSLLRPSEDDTVTESNYDFASTPQVSGQENTQQYQQQTYQEFDQQQPIQTYQQEQPEQHQFEQPQRQPPLLSPSGSVNSLPVPGKPLPPAPAISPRATLASPSHNVSLTQLSSPSSLRSTLPPPSSATSPSSSHLPPQAPLPPVPAQRQPSQLLPKAFPAVQVTSPLASPSFDRASQVTTTSGNSSPAISPTSSMTSTSPLSFSPTGTTSPLSSSIEFSSRPETPQGSTEYLDNPLLRSANSPPLAKRDHIALEILNTERNYLGNLTFLVQTFLIPLRTEKFEGVPLLPPETIANIFSNVEEIIQVNKVLLQDLEKRMSDWWSKPCLGEIFEKLTYFLKMYNLYTSQYESAMNTLNECEKLPHFVMFVKKWEDLPDRPHNLNLRALLIQPVQRIPRYRLLLEDLLKHTPPDHIDHNSLKAAVERVKQVADDINESIKRAENRQKVLQIQNSFVVNSIFASEVRLVEPSRVFIKEGGLLKICRKARKMRYFFLFNDILVYADMMPLQENKYILHLQVELAKLRLQDIPDQGGRDPIANAFQIINQKKTFIVISKSKEEKYEWMGAIMSAIDESVRRKQTLNRRQGHEEDTQVFEAPLWVQDKDASHCFKCHDEFTFVNRRHHCRACGNVVCGDCSNRKMALPGSSELQRVCVNCYYAHKSKATGTYSAVFS